RHLRLKLEVRRERRGRRRAKRRQMSSVARLPWPCGNSNRVTADDEASAAFGRGDSLVCRATGTSPSDHVHEPQTGLSESGWQPFQPASFRKSHITSTDRAGFAAVDKHYAVSEDQSVPVGFGSQS